MGDDDGEAGAGAPLTAARCSPGVAGPGGGGCGAGGGCRRGRRARAHGAAALVHGGLVHGADPEPGRVRVAVQAHHGHVLGDAQAQGLRGHEGAHGHLVGDAEHGGGPALRVREQGAGAVVGVAHREVGGQHPVGRRPQARRGEGVQEAAGAFGADLELDVVRHAPHVGDLPVPQLDQVPGGHAGRPRVVHLDRREPLRERLAGGQAAAHRDDGPAQPRQAVELERAEPEGEGDEGVQAAAGQQVGQDGRAAVVVLAHVVEREVVAAADELVRRALQDGGEEPAVDGGGHEADVPGPAGGQRGGRGIGHVAEGGHGLLDAGARGRRHRAGARQGAGGGGRRDTRHAGDVLDADHAAGPPLRSGTVCCGSPCWGHPTPRPGARWNRFHARGRAARRGRTPRIRAVPRGIPRVWKITVEALTLPSAVPLPTGTGRRPGLGRGPAGPGRLRRGPLVP